ncbi:MAG: hypothetical protein B7Y46_15805 [Acidovorax sp. 28-64-14]|jgi:hypothetical protein|nr:MAG: hypothetical protein B7Y46_15805 [Acidovorax sp. 28-64-14]
MMKKSIFLGTLVIAGAISGCTPTSAVRLPDGGEGFTIACGGTLRSWASCYEAAGEKCGARGYDIINKSSDTTIDTASRSMLIKCKQ